MYGQIRIRNILQFVLYLTFSLISLGLLTFSCMMLYMERGNGEIYMSILTTILGLFFPSPLTSISQELTGKKTKKRPQPLKEIMISTTEENPMTDFSPH
ncbi:MAG: hypothetical protein KAS12_01580 [Candidatus Aenigmarchaeota archaeon]|nr:hypothetical protein [Candidatus Aenigmarchaeota archaeon]